MDGTEDLSSLMSDIYAKATCFLGVLSSFAPILLYHAYLPVYVGCNTVLQLQLGWA